MHKQVEHLLVEAVRNNILPVTGKCNLSCVFCSHRYNPSEAHVYDLPPLPMEQLIRLIDGLDPSLKIVIGESATRLREGEPFSHPHILEILKILRERFPGTPLQITTNGSLLTPTIVQQLSRMQPLELILSANSSSEKGRRLLMGDSKPGRIIDLINDLSLSNINFHGSVVAMPNLVGWDDIEETLRFLELKGARTIRIFVPGFTCFTPDKLATPPSVLIRLHEFIKSMQGSLTCPLLVEPPGVEDLNPLIEGTIKGSPASEAGLQRNDIIVSVNGQNPRCRVEAFNLIQRNRNPALRISRKHEILEKTIFKRKNETSGVTMLYDLDPRHIKTVRSYAETGKKVLLLTSVAAAPLWKAVSSVFNMESLAIVIVSSLFWGGSICCAGLLTVEDFKQEIYKLPLNYKPEIVMLPPEAFDFRGLDILGQSYLEIAELFQEKIKIIS